MKRKVKWRLLANVEFKLNIILSWITKRVKLKNYVTSRLTIKTDKSSYLKTAKKQEKDEKYTFILNFLDALDWKQ